MDNNIQTILWLLMIGFAVAAVAVYCSNRFLGGFVRALLAVDATSPESALTMKELGVKSNPLLRAALGRKGEFTRMVADAGGGKYYIAPERLGLAKVKYREKGAGLLSVLLLIAVAALCTLAFTYIFPEVLDAVSNMLSQLFRKDARQ